MFLYVKYIIDVLVPNKCFGESAIMDARQLKIASRIDAYMISTTRNIQYVLKNACVLNSFCERHI